MTRVDVYVALGGFDYEGQDIVGVATNFDDAKAICERRSAAAPGVAYDWHEIQRWPLGPDAGQQTECWRRRGPSDTWEIASL